MADHGLTGTHHLDGSMCTRTDSCPWSAKDYMAKLQGKTTLPVGPESFGGDVSKVFEAIMNLAPEQQGGSQSPATVMPRRPSSRKTKTPPPLGPVVPMPQQIHSQVMPHPADQALLSQQISDALNSGAPMTPTKEVPPKVSSDNPITPADLRADWPTHPDLTDEQRAILASLPDAGLQQVLDEAFLDSEGPWRAIRKETLTRATDALVKSLPSPDSAPVGTQDECLNCGLPITAQDGPPRWSDDIMGTTTCDRMKNLTGHSPKDVLTKFKAAMAKAAKPKSDGRRLQYRLLDPQGTEVDTVESVEEVGTFAINMTEDGLDYSIEIVHF